MLRKCVWVPVMILALFPALASAQFQDGDWELTLTGSGSSSDDFDSTFLNVGGSLGYFFSDQIEVGVRQGVSFSENGDSDFNGSTAVFGDFHFDLDRWQPFVGGQIGYIYGDSASDTFVAGPEGGVKYFVNNTTFIFGSVAYQFFFDDDDDDDNDGLWVYALGIGFRW